MSDWIVDVIDVISINSGLTLTILVFQGEAGGLRGIWQGLVGGMGKTIECQLFEYCQILMLQSVNKKKYMDGRQIFFKVCLCDLAVGDSRYSVVRRCYWILLGLFSTRSFLRGG